MPRKHAENTSTATVDAEVVFSLVAESLSEPTADRELERALALLACVSTVLRDAVGRRAEHLPWRWKLAACLRKQRETRLDIAGDVIERHDPGVDYLTAFANVALAHPTLSEFVAAYYDVPVPDDAFQFFNRHVFPALVANVRAPHVTVVQRLFDASQTTDCFYRRMLLRARMHALHIEDERDKYNEEILERLRAQIEGMNAALAEYRELQLAWISELLLEIGQWSDVVRELERAWSSLIHKYITTLQSQYMS